MAKPKSPKKLVPVSVKIAPELKAAIERIADAEHRSVSNVIQLALIALVEERKKRG
jgi:predicted transcriptional regulator